MGESLKHLKTKQDMPTAFGTNREDNTDEDNEGTGHIPGTVWRR